MISALIAQLFLGLLVGLWPGGNLPAAAVSSHAGVPACAPREAPGPSSPAVAVGHVAASGLPSASTPSTRQDAARREDAVSAQDAAAILTRAAERHRGLPSLSASFTQRIRNPILETEETSAGTFYFRAPLQYRIAFSRPPDDVVVSTGDEVWIYLPSSQPGQVIKTPVTEGTKGFAPYQFIYDFKDRYEAALVGEERVSGQPSYHLSLTPLSERSEYTRAELWIDKQTALTRQMEVEERNGVVRRFTLAGHRPGARLAPSLFRFDPPRGVEVFEQ
jgi:outer membrane lipoprotein carrier protein